MRRRALVTVCTAALAWTAAGAAAAGVSVGAKVSPGTPPGFCAASDEYRALWALVDQTLDSEGVAGGDTSILEEALGVQGLTFAPRLAQLAEEMATGVPRNVRRELRVQRRLLRKGLRSLRRAGLTDEQVESLASVGFTTGDEAGDLAGMPGVDADRLRREGLAFAPEVRRQRARVDRLARVVQATSIDCL